jgi:alpha-beta hydrolase superfamily lysophospholipase
MSTSKRELFRLTGAAMAGAGLAACGGGQAAVPQKAAFVLVHGAWHGAWCFERIAALLAAAGHAVVARDLPAHGLNAALPATYLDRASPAAFEAEPSPVGGTTLEDYASSVLSSVEALRAAGHRQVIVVGHSMGASR